jgi:hypothetical protein
MTPTPAFPQPIGGRTDAAASGGNDQVMSPNPIVDLAERHSRDLDVVLIWGRRTGRLWVTVTHGRTARINATPANALDVFRHPFAYGRERP